ncbi:MAG: inositol monophosphatase family protein [Ilumatobacter sp.]|uniref:inositol monophosphatase family protein n=1 Tax=Ilumatobacter sp. TaxID=1967498 RepID=UPI00391A9E46
MSDAFADDHRPDSADFDALRLLALDIASEAAGYADAARSALGPGRRVAHETKSSDVDPVTRFDRETEALVVERLRAARPDDSIVGEEGANHRGNNDFEWHIDPIDGTVNFVYDLPGWCTSIGVLYGGEPVAAAIVAPRLGDRSTSTFSAALGGGAFLGDAPIHASEATDLTTSLMATGFSYHLDAHRDRQAARIAVMLPQVRDIRRMGSAALDLAFVAAGRLDGYFEEFISSWDVAAGVLLVREAGGTVTAFDGEPLDVRAPRGVLAAGPAIHRVLDAALHRAR